jgi:hypothetical protein
MRLTPAEEERMRHPRLLGVRIGATPTASWRRVLLATLYFLLGLAPSASGGVLVGNDWRQLPTIARESYVVGTIDAWQVVDATIDEPTRSLPVGIFHSVTSCAETGDMTGHEAFAIVEKYMAERPAEWQKAMAVLVLQAIVASCK